MNAEVLDLSDLFIFTPDEHAAHHRRTIDEFEKNDDQHDELWEVILTLQNHIDALESNRDGF